MSAVLDNPTLSTPALPGCAIEIFETMSDWLRARELVIGASESPSVIGVGYADESPLSVWGRKRGLIESKPDTEALECGRVLQPAILELFSRRSGFRVQSLGEFTLCKSIQHPWLGASLDGVIVDTDDGAAVVEAKNVGVFMSHEWRDEEQPLKFQVQVQQQMEVAGVDRAFTVGLIGGNKLRYIETRRNQKFIDALLPRLAEFMDLVEAGEEPSGKWIDGSEATRKALQKLHPLDNGETKVLPLESADWRVDLDIVKEKIYQFSTEQKRLENAIKSHLGDYTYGLLPDGTRYSWKHQTTSRTCEQCGFVKESEPFRVLRHSKK